MSQTLWIARHGHRYDFADPEWFNSAERRYDPPLSEEGHRQAQQLARRLQSKAIAHIFCSPFLRAIQTAHPVAEALNLRLKLEAGLGEWHNPEWMSEAPQIHPRHLLEKDYPRIDWGYSSRILPVYPESETLLNQRAAAIVQLLIKDFSEDILLVGHDGTVAGTSHGLVEGQPVTTVPLCSLVKIVRDGEKWQLLLNGDTSHLDSDWEGLWER
jgi:broad specificity phosphatase PhoE